MALVQPILGPDQDLVQIGMRLIHGQSKKRSIQVRNQWRRRRVQQQIVGQETGMAQLRLHELVAKVRNVRTISAAASCHFRSKQPASPVVFQ